MGQQVYKELFDVMKNRRGPYTGVDIPEFYELVEELFTPQEAEVNNLWHPLNPVWQNRTKHIGNCSHPRLPKKLEKTHHDGR